VADNADAFARTAYLITRDLSEAEDLVQETLIRVARRWGRVGSMDHPAAYARRILVNLALDAADVRVRHREELGYTAHSLDAHADERATGELVAVQNRSELGWALAALPRQQRAVMVLRYWEDLPEAEVAEILGCSIGTVKKATWRGAIRLRETLVGTASPLSGVTANGGNRS